MTDTAPNPAHQERVHYIGLPNGQKLFQVAPSKVHDIVAQDARLEYKPISEWWLEYQLSLRRRDDEPVPDDNTITYNSIYAFRDMFLRDQVRRVRNEFSGQELYIRGSATYIDDTITLMPDGLYLFNPIQALKHGREKSARPGEQIPTYKLAPEGTDSGALNLRTWSWLTMHPQNIRKEFEDSGKKDKAEKVFPMLMFFTKDSLDEQHIVRALIFDMPLIRQEYRGAGGF